VTKYAKDKMTTVGRTRNYARRKGRSEITRKKEHKLSKWEQIQQSLQALRQDLNGPLLYNEEKADIIADIWRLRKRNTIVAVCGLEMDERGEEEILPFLAIGI
jgi:hypothetical protein